LPRSRGRERVEHDRERRGEQESAESALQQSRYDEPRLCDFTRRGRSAQHGSDREANRAHQHHPPVTDDIAQLATEREHRGQRKQIGIDHPLKPCRGQ
jgi:hypothetical protein